MIGAIVLILAVIFVAVFAGIFFGNAVLENPGYVQIIYSDWSIETSVWVAALMLVVLYFLVRFVIWAVGRIWGTPGGILHWNSRRRIRQARKETADGLVAMAAGDWAQARKLLIHAAPHSDQPLVNYLNVAQIAHLMGNDEERELYLERASALDTDSERAVLLSRAEMHVDRQEWDDAAISLQALADSGGKLSTRARQLQRRVLEELGDWEALLGLLPAFKKAAVLDKQRLEARELWYWQQRLIDEHDPAVARRLHKKAPRKLRLHPDLAGAFAESLVVAGEEEAAERLLRDAIGKRWRDELVAQYGTVRGDVENQLAVARKWLGKHPGDATLLTTLGHLCLANDLPEDARLYFEEAIDAGAPEAARVALGRLYAAAGDETRAVTQWSEAVGAVPGVERYARMSETTVPLDDEVVAAVDLEEDPKPIDDGDGAAPAVPERPATV